MPSFVKSSQTIVEISQFFDFQYGVRPPSFIFKMRHLAVTGLHRASTHHRANFCQNRSSGRWVIAISWYSRWRPSAILDFQKCKHL